MNRQSSRLVSLLTFLTFAASACASIHSLPAVAQTSVQSAPSVSITGSNFIVDGKPLQIISGEMHYPRIPHEYWHDRLMKAKALGLNTITTYVFWNIHEPTPGVYDFSGDRDVAGFIREAQAVGLNVILRPGPYVCAEWEFGGLPFWLLKKPGMTIRSGDPKFMAPVRSWLTRLGQELAPLQHTKGGPIIAVQVENEYGSFEADTNYLESIHQALKDAGFGESVLFTSNPPEDINDGSLAQLPTVVNFGAGHAKAAFATLQKLRPGEFMMSGEYWAGWFDSWGGPHYKSNIQKQTDELTWMLKQGYSLNLYMFHGGTNFGWMGGATGDDAGKYEPITTSYDYDSALDESGRPTPKYAAFRTAITQATGITPPDVPATPPAITIPPFVMKSAISLWKVLPAPKRSDTPLSMEDLDQAYGYILYRTHIAKHADADLVLEDLHDFAHVYLDGTLVTALDRRKKENLTHFAVNGETGWLDVLVENTGRLNYTVNIRNERKGITKRALYAGEELKDWEIYSLPMTRVRHLPFTAHACTGPCFYNGTFNVTAVGDTFLDMSAWHKGQVWINGRALGRFWDVGPQKSLYVPAPWLKKGANTIQIFDLRGESGRKVQGLPIPALGN